MKEYIIKEMELKNKDITIMIPEMWKIISGLSMNAQHILLKKHIKN